MTFAASANVIVHCGARPVFVDVEPETLNIDPERIEPALRRRSRAILPVHYLGQACDMKRIGAIARRRGLAVVEDAAHAVETVAGGRKVGSISDFTAFSFYATKNITTGEGGMLTTNRRRLAERARVLALHGMSRDAWKRYSAAGFRHYEVVAAGFKYNMFDLQAALGLTQLAQVERFAGARRSAFARYLEAIAEVPGITPLRQAPARPGDVNALHLFVVRVDRREAGLSRDALMAALQRENIGVGVHFRAVHLHPFYRKTFGTGRGLCPVAERASDELLSLPFFPSMRTEEIDDVAEALRRIVSYCRARKPRR
jgi:dTDP-4-amino-4,6-dideoxygalactose transaminase